jgi:hypothetical protein
MPLGRSARQRRGRSAPRDPNAWRPRVDVFGTLRLPTGGEARGRLIEYAPSQFAFFTVDNIEDPVTFRIDGEFAIKGRLFTAYLEHQGSEIKFQKAGCGCETPHQLRGARAPLLAHVPIAEAEADEAVPDTVHELQMQDVPRQL